MLFKNGTLAEQFEECLDENQKDKGDRISVGEEEMDVDVSIEEKLASLEKKYKESQNIIKMLNEKILFLETKNVSFDENDD